MDQKVVQWWQGELDRREARIAELEQWQAEAVAMLRASRNEDYFEYFAQVDELLEQVTTKTASPHRAIDDLAILDGMSEVEGG